MQRRSDDTTLDRPPRQGESPLSRNVSFQALWVGSACSFLGKEVTDLVYPLIILGITGSASQAALFGAVQTFTLMALSIPGGEITDRFDKRRLLLIVETLRFTATATVAVAVAMHRLTVAHLILVGIVVGAVQPIGAYARMLLVRAVVPPSQLTAALTQEEVRTYGSSLAGPPLGGWLYGLSHVLPVASAALTYAMSFVCALFVRPPVNPAQQAPQPTQASALRRMLAGLTSIWLHPNLRRVLLFTTAMNAASAPLVLLVVVQLKQQGMSSTVIGLSTTGLAVGGLTGAALVTSLHRRFSPGTLMLCQGAALTVLIAALAAPAGPWWLGIVLLLSDIGVPMIRVLVDITIFRQAPEDQRGRVVAAAMTVYGVGASAGLFLAGLMLKFLSAPATALVVAASLTVALGAALANPRFRHTQWPSEPSTAAARGDAVEDTSS